MNKKITNTMLCILYSIGALAQSNFLPEAYSTNWNNAGKVGGIPCMSNYTNIATLGISSNNADNSGILQQILNTTPPNTVLYFPAGIYNFNQSINVPSGITIRGAGADATTFNFSSDMGFTAFGTENTSFNNVIWGKGKGSTQMGIGNVAGYQVGDYVDIYQANIAAKMQTTFPTNWDQPWSQEAVGMLAKITSIDNSIDAITIDRPLKIDLSDDNGAGYVRVRKLNVLQNIGFENFKIVHSNTNYGYTFYLNKTANCWFAGVESAWAVSRHISVEQSANITIRNCYIHDAHNYGSAYAYGTELIRHTTDCLVENNIFNNLRHAMMVHVGANGNVFAHNYSHMPYIVNNFVQTDISVHGHYPYMNLFEGNVVNKIMTTDWWGPAGIGNTFLRNRVKLSNFHIFDNSVRQNIVGNEVLGSGTLMVDANIQAQTLQHANYVNGTVSYNANFGSVPVSFFRVNRPNYYDFSYNYPALGPEVATQNHQIPAQSRYLNGTPVPYFDACNNAELAPLPVDWLYITAQLKAGDIVLHFGTSTEKNNNYFEIEKSIDGTHFSYLTTINAKNHQNKISEYIITDETPEYGYTNYYRVKQIDFDGKFGYSKTVYITLKNNDTPTNIYTDGKQIYIDSNSSAPYLVQIIDTKGDVIMKKQGARSQNIQINIENLPKGVYLVRVLGGGRQETKKIVVN